MGSLKSLMHLWKEVANELATWCHTSTALDFKKLRARVEHEGNSFLTITLPNFGKDFERSLDLGRVDPDLFKSFKRRGSLPLFLGGFLDLVFDRRTGHLLPEPDVDSIFAIRQLTLMFGKILLPCSDARTEDAINGYWQLEKEFEFSEKSISAETRNEFQRISGLLFSEVFTKVDKLVYDNELIPRHGPGATADRLLGNKKFDQREWPLRLEEIMPSSAYLFPSWSKYKLYDDVKLLEPEAERPVRVITVPKTLKTPRIIAIEPTCMQYAQQAILQPLVEGLDNIFGGSQLVRAETLKLTRNLEGQSRGFLGFREQGPNQDLALAGSKFGELATLDLSEASDRVLNAHVQLLLARWPWLSEAVQASRSRKAHVPGKGEITLTKFASMGSALCFPMEAMVFLTVIFMGIQDGLSYQMSKKDILSFLGRVRVYGDDLIVPVEYVYPVMSRLESFGFKVNGSKSFWTGKFRESCGKEYYDGHDVSISRVRRILPESLADTREVISCVALRNQLYFAGLWKSARYLDVNLEKLLKGNFPVVEVTSPALGRHSVSFSYQAERLSEDTHAPKVKAWCIKTRPPRSKASGEGSLMKCLLKQGESPFEDPRHLEYQGRPAVVDIKLRWMIPF
jgi:hypothetical protein